MVGGTVLTGSVDASGDYTITGAAPGQYSVVAEAPGDGPAEQSPVTVTAGATTAAVDLGLTDTPATVSGTVTDADTGAPISGATVSTDAANGAGGPVTTGTDGSYTLTGLPEGPVDLTVDPPDTTHIVGTATVTATGGSTTTANITLDPVGTVTATVDAGDGTTPLPGVTVDVVGPSPGSADAPEQTQSEVTDSSGQISVTGLSTGTYDLQVPGSDVHQSFAIGTGDRTTTVDLSVPTGTVSGQVEDATGDPVAGVQVSLDDAAGSVATSQTDTDGDYTFTVDAAGTMDVVATGAPVGVLIASGVTVGPGRRPPCPPCRPEPPRSPSRPHPVGTRSTAPRSSRRPVPPTTSRHRWAPPPTAPGPRSSTT